MHFETSPGSSPSKSIPISMSTMASPTGSLYSNYSFTSSTSSRASTCAYPSWPSGSSLEYRNNTPSSFISDADLFGDLDDDLASPYLQEAPAPPRQPPMSQQFFLPPLYATEKPKKQSQQQQQRRRSSGRKQRRSSKPMTPISESPEAQRE